MAEPSDAALVADGLGDGLAQHDADILGGVVEVHMQVALRRHRQVEQRVAGQRGQHVVEETDAGRDFGPPAAVQVQREADLGLGGGAGQAGDAGHGLHVAQRRREGKGGFVAAGLDPATHAVRQITKRQRIVS